MIDARTYALNAILSEDFSLVHITWYVQRRNEWFGVVSSGQFDYHSIDIGETALSVTASSRSAVAAGRGVFDATINGMRRPWRLQFTVRLAKHDDAWRIVEARYTTF